MEEVGAVVMKDTVGVAMEEVGAGVVMEEGAGAGE